MKPLFLFVKMIYGQSQSVAVLLEGSHLISVRQVPHNYPQTVNILHLQVARKDRQKFTSCPHSAAKQNDSPIRGVMPVLSVGMLMEKTSFIPAAQDQHLAHGFGAFLLKVANPNVFPTDLLTILHLAATVVSYLED